jgi:folylpolyglutamate synthase/dihydropteroate synthase
MADKDVDGVIRALAESRMLDRATVIATSPGDVPRALPAEALAATWRRVAPGRREILALDDPIAATERAIAAGRGRGLTIVAGSLYLVGAVRGHLVDDPELRDPVAP